MSLREALVAGPYQAYAYAYPHKTAYRELEQPVALDELWSRERRDALFAYVHVPFCTYRCGFCNLFALGRPGVELVERYVEQLLQQIRVVGDALGEHHVARFALGGGTPSYLEPAQLERVFEQVTAHLDIDLHAIPAGVEVSPETATLDRLAICRDAGCDRISMGVQSFVDAELAALVRPVQRREVIDAVAAVRSLGFPTLNLDLIYGIHGQSTASLTESVRTALSFEPEELYLYPLYVRAKTGLGRMGSRSGDAHGSDPRLDLYRHARDLLLDAGYQQVSMRMFRAPHAPEVGGPAYCCQNDGMVGVGCGARSYARGLHYSDRYGVARERVSEILRQYVEAPAAAFASARYGFVLNDDEQRRRFVIQSLLVWPGLELPAYAKRFGSPLFADLPQLEELLTLELAQLAHGCLSLTSEGMAHADTIGPWLASPAVIERMGHYAVA